MVHHGIQNKHLTGHKRRKPVQVDRMNSPVGDQITPDREKNQDVDTAYNVPNATNGGGKRAKTASAKAQQAIN